MNYTVYHYIWFFFVYSFLGWVGEEIYAMFKYGRFVNRGFVNGPVCLKYGIAMVVIIFDIHDLSANPLYQSVICIVLIAVMEYMSGVIIRRITGMRLWDYSNVKANVGGYTCAASALIGGLTAAVIVWTLHPFFYIAFSLVPLKIMKIIQIVAIIIFFIDLFVTVAASLQWKFEGNIYGSVAQTLDNTKKKLGYRLYEAVKQRMYKSFPELEGQEKNEIHGFGKTKNRVFAKGLCFDKLVWIFFISALVGDLIETVFVWATAGVLMSRSSLLYGPFSIVWGLGGAFATGILYPLKDKNDRFVFLGGFFLGGVYEYSCSVFTEVVFGTVFWDYSHMPFNINGRINLLFCFFWGIAAIVWVKMLYPAASRLIEKIPPVAGKLMTYCVIIFMALNMIISASALGRYVNRKAGAEASNAVEQFIDDVYPDRFIEKIYPNMKIR